MSNKERVYDKINYQTNFTSTSTFAILLKAIKDYGNVDSEYARTTLFPQARSSAGMRYDPSNRDTHGEITLAQYGLIEYLDEKTFKLSSLGFRFLELFNDDFSVKDGNDYTYLSTMVDALFSWKETKYGRNINVGALLLKLLLDEKIDKYITAEEWSYICEFSGIKSDNDYNQLVANLLTNREKKVLYPLKKADVFLGGFAGTWRLLDKKEINGETRYYLNEQCQSVVSEKLKQVFIIDKVDYGKENEDILNHNLYGIHIKMENTALSDDDPHICIGWSSLGDLSNFSSKDDLRAFYEEQNPESSKNSIGQNVGQIWRFINEASIGDYVILGENNYIHIGKITSNFYYDNNPTEGQNPDYVNIRKVQWIKKYIDRKLLSLALHHSIGTAMSFFTLNDYRSAVASLISGSYVKDESFDEVIDTISYDDVNRKTGGTNIILYGVPGAGKSWTIKKEYCEDETKMERLVFHPDYTYSDFVGQILPKLNKEGNVTYVFTAGPFTNLLKKAYENPNEMFFLVIEEVNRGNAPAIFGDIFQLLDRNKKGDSEYKITNPDIAQIVYGDENHKISIPSNMSILCTMNTSDQNVFTLDTAFQRRWSMRLIKNQFHPYEEDEQRFAKTKILDTNITWEHFFTEINKIILEKNIKMTSSEDKRLGTHFVNEDDLLFDNTVDANGLMTVDARIQNSKFPEKVLKYLWDDAFKFTKEDVFDTEKYKSLEDLIDKFVNSVNDERFKIFKENIFNTLMSSTNN